MSDYSNDIKRYLHGEMTSAERHAFERKALADPFLADALEGAEQVSSAKFTSDLDSIHQRIEKVNKKSTLKKLINPASEENVRSLHYWAWVAPVAATLLLIAVSTFIVWKISRPTEQPEQLAHEKSIPNVQPTDVVVVDSTALSEPLKNEIAIKETPPAVKSHSSPTKQPKSIDVYTNPSVAGKEAAVEATADEEEQTQSVIAEVKISEKEEAASATATVTDKDVSETPAKDDEFAGKRKKEVTRFAESRETQAKATIIQGKVAAEDNSPLPGINVTIKGTNIGTITDEQGNYQVSVGTPNTTLVYSFIGLQSQEVAVANSNEVDITMKQDVSQLSEVVVLGSVVANKGIKPTVNFAHTQIGGKAFKDYLEKNLRYPQRALETKTEGRVIVDFFVEADGSLTNFTTVRGIGSGCEEELIRLIKEGPQWIATQKDSIAVRDKVRIQLKFDLPKK